MLKIGITGGIGSGKTVVSKIVEAFGYPVFYSDSESKYLSNYDPGIRAGLIQKFGEEVYVDDQLNRPFLAQQIFHHPESRVFVNNLIHPAVREAFVRFAEEQATNYVFNEAAILFETGAYKTFDKTVLITAPEELRLQRVMQRDNVTEEQVRARMRNQWPDEEKIPLADFIIYNDETRSLIEQVKEMLDTLAN